jgi:hypothetical protein
MRMVSFPDKDMARGKDQCMDDRTMSCFYHSFVDKAYLHLHNLPLGDNPFCKNANHILGAARRPGHSGHH